jgi:putative ABC transport system substrate-binding protein
LGYYKPLFACVDRAFSNQFINSRRVQFFSGPSKDGMCRQLDIYTARTGREIDLAFADLVQNGAQVLLVGPSSLFIARRMQLSTQAARHALPTIHFSRDYVEAGGLMSYGSSISDATRQAAIYAGRIIKGDKPAELPVIQASKFEFVINLQTARVMGIEVPPALLARADEVIE